MVDFFKKIKSLVPDWLLDFIRPGYHLVLAWLGNVVYRKPSKELRVIAVTGTKGKTTTTELIAHILRGVGELVAVSNTVRFAVGDNSRKNLRKMSMPGRFFLQRFLRKAVDAGCTTAVIEMTSEGAAQFRHRFIQLDSLVFTNLSPEHIESHGSFKAYRKAKVSIARQLARSEKSPTSLIINADDENSHHFVKPEINQVVRFRLSDAEPFTETQSGTDLTIGGEQVRVKLFGEFNIYNMLAAANTARIHGVSPDDIRAGLSSFSGVPGRLEAVDEGQDFGVYIDYAHTPDSLERVYKTFSGQEKICVLGNAGGGRDKWKRPKMAKLAENHCRQIILTDEDPYDEHPRKIVEEMAKAITIPKYEIIMDRRLAIRTALEKAKPGEVVLLTGKGTDPYIARSDGKRESWDEIAVTREELKSLQNKQAKKGEDKASE